MFRIYSKSGYVIGEFDELADAMRCLSEWIQAAYIVSTKTWEVVATNDRQ